MVVPPVAPGDTAGVGPAVTPGVGPATTVVVPPVLPVEGPLGAETTVVGVCDGTPTYPGTPPPLGDALNGGVL
jgi:hypothetical protein